MAINSSLSNKKVAFLSGTSTKLAEFLNESHANYGKAVEGTFYLTTDTHQLYVGQKDGSTTNVFPVLVNSGVVTVESVKDLDPVLGSICYVETGNILCRWNGTTWAQINPDTDTDTRPRTLTLTKNVDTTNDKITITGKLTTKDINGNNLADDANLQSTIEILGSDIASVVTDVEVEQEVTNGSNAATIGITGTGAKANGTVATIAGGTNVTVTGNASTDTITIAATDTTYSGKTTAASNKFAIVNSGDDEVGAVTFTAGTAMSVSTVASGTGSKNAAVTIGHGTVSSSTTTGTATILSDSQSLGVVTGVTVNSEGHVTGVETTSVSAVNNDTTYHIDAISATNEGKISVTLKDHGGNGNAVLSGQDLYYKLGSAANATKLYNQADLTAYFYTESEIDAKLKDLNAITYKGTVGGTGSGATVSTLPTSNVKIGDAYLVTGAALVTYDSTNNLTAKQGDLLIATGTENSSGVITSGLAWTHVPSGDDIDTTYTLSANSNNIRLQASTDPDGSSIQSVTIAGGTDLTASTSSNTITINHDAVSGGAITKNASTTADSSAALNASGKFKVIDTLTTNAQGHVTGATLKEFTLPADNNSEYDLVSLANEASIKLRDTTDGNTLKGTITFSSISDGNITIDGSAANTIKIGHGDISCTKTTASSATTLSTTATNVITGITVSSQGHVTAVTTTPINVAVDNDTTYKIGEIVNNASNGRATVASTSANGTTTISVKDTLTDINGGKTYSEFKIATQSLTTSVTNNNVINLDVQWGSF